MNKRRMLILAAALLGGLVLFLSADVLSVVEGLVTIALAQDTASIPWWVVAGGGGDASDAGKVEVNSTLGQPIIGTSSDGSVSLGAGYWYGAQGPTAVTLASFTATPQEGDILVAWETAIEIDTVGFNLYHAQSPDGPYVKLNEALIPSQSPGSVFGATYVWLDGDVQAGITYYYKLEDVEVGGRRTIHGPIAAQAGGPTAVTLQVLSAHGTPSLLLLAALIATSGLVAWWIRKRSAGIGWRFQRIPGKPKERRPRKEM